MLIVFFRNARALYYQGDSMKAYPSERMRQEKKKKSFPGVEKIVQRESNYLELGQL